MTATRSEIKRKKKAKQQQKKKTFYDGKMIK